MLIGDLFDRNPKRPIDPIVKVTQHDPAVVYQELDEYVVTDEIRRDLNDFLDRFVESRLGVPPSVCAWISGFFGSGKSHFLKVLGYVLANRPIRLENGSEQGAARFFCRKHSLPQGLILEQELATRALFVNMLDFDREHGPGISRIIYRALLTDLGLSDVFWVAEVERMLQVRGLWEDFLSFVQRTEGQPWPEVRRMQVRARPVLARALQELDPAAYPTLELALEATRDAEKDFSLDAERLARRLLEEAEAIHPQKGRIVILLDEVGLYIGTHTDRLTELNAISELITRVGRGKVWLIATAQEALEQVIPRVEARAGQFQWIQDRFQIKVRLTPENIDTVVKKRLLQKTADKAKQQALRQLYRAHAGTLATAALIKDPARDYRSLFTRLDEEEFVAAYPLLPYHVRLMQEAFGALRSRGGASQDLTGRERAVLGVVRATLIGVRDRQGLADRPLGELATFDMVYDAIDEELRAVRSAQQAVIEHDIAGLGEREGVRVDAVAKALFLLQQVGDWLPCTVENISAVLYPRLGAEKQELEKGVRACLAALREGVWVTEEEGKYRFLSEVERTFEQDVARQTANEPEKRQLTQEILKSVLKDLKSYNYRNLRSFNVRITADDVEVTSKGQLALVVYSPMRAANEPALLDSLFSPSIRNRDTVYWIAGPDERFETALERVICVREALKEHEAKAQSEDEQRALMQHRRAMEILRDDDLPRLLSNALATGTILYQGDDQLLDGRKGLREIFNEQMKELVKELFTEFHHAAYAVERDEHIGAILTWQGGALPRIYQDVQLVDDQGQILVERPVAARILEEVGRRKAAHLENTGRAIVDHFEAPPYGWDPRIVRLTLATLFRNGSISVTLDGKEYVSAKEPGAHEAFTNARSFNRAHFTPGQQVTPEQRDRAAQLISEIFGRWGGQTVEEVDAALREALSPLLEEGKRLTAIATTVDLPVADGLRSLVTVMEEILDASTFSRRVLRFLNDERLATLRDQVPVLQKLRNFEDGENITRYQHICHFADIVERQLITVIGDGDVEEQVDALNQRLRATDFLDRWPDIVSGYEALRGLYVQAYQSRHRERQQRVEEALQQLRDHPLLAELTSGERARRLHPLTELVCEEIGPAVDEGQDFVCRRCRSTLADLSYHLELIELRQEKIRRELNEEWAEGQIQDEGEVEYVEGLKAEQEINSVEEMSELTTRMQVVAERALATGRRVRAKVEIKVK
jgi:hypothetical protein